jgi:hypothetical protein
MTRRDGFSLHPMDEPAPEDSGQSTADSWSSKLPEIRPGQISVDSIAKVKKKARSRNYEKAHKAGQLSVRGVPPKFHEQVRAIAEDLNVRVDHVSRAFLEYGLKAYLDKKFSIKSRINGRKLSLYSQDGWGRETPGWQEVIGWQAPVQKDQPAIRKKKKIKKESPKLWKYVMTFHELKQETKAQLNELCEKEFIPKGELVSALLAYSIQAYQDKAFTLALEFPTPGDVKYVE